MATGKDDGVDGVHHADHASVVVLAVHWNRIHLHRACLNQNCPHLVSICHFKGNLVVNGVNSNCSTVQSTQRLQCTLPSLSLASNLAPALRRTLPNSIKLFRLAMCNGDNRDEWICSEKRSIQLKHSIYTF